MSLEKERFFEVAHEQGLALTYGDVKIAPGPSYFAPSDIDIKSRFTRNIELSLPIVSAAMDTVTGSEMAIAMAKMGGLGIIHAAMDAKAQRNEVREVKLALNGLIEGPISYDQEVTIEQVLSEKRKFSTFPVLDQDGKLTGLLTQKDIDFADGVTQRLEDVMTPLSRVQMAPPETSIEEAYKLMKEEKKKMLPLVDGDGQVAGLYIWSDVKRLVEGNDEHYNLDEENRLRVGAAVSTDEEETLSRLDLMSKYLDVAVVDTAQGDSMYAFRMLKAIKSAFPKLEVVVGNVSNAQSAQDLAKAGADGIKVGQGPGSICTTRVETGIGMPQVSAVYECAQAVKEYGVPVCADGGITQKGDLTVAIAAGAHTAMMGNMLAGTDEVPTEIVTLPDGQRLVAYRGMGSADAMRDSQASRRRYNPSGVETLLAEGVTARVSYKGSVIGILEQLSQALRKGMYYSGARNIRELQENTRFIRQTSEGIREASPHDVSVVNQ